MIGNQNFYKHDQIPLLYEQTRITNYATTKEEDEIYLPSDLIKQFENKQTTIINNYHSGFLLLFGRLDWNNPEGSLRVFDTSKIKVKKVVSGEQFCVLLTEDGKCYMIGEITSKDGLTFKPYETLWNEYGIHLNKEPTLIEWTVDDPIEDVYAHTYLVFLNKKGQIYAYTTDKNDALFGKIDSKQFNYEKVINGDCGNDHILILTENNNIYSFGTNYNGQLGGQTQDSHTRRFIKADTSHITSKISKVYCTYNTSLILTEDGKCYSCGDSTYSANGQLDNNVYDRYKFTLIPKLENEFIEEIHAGLFFLSLRAKSGKYFVFGYNNFCQFGTSNTIPVTNIRGATLLDTFNNDDIEEMECGGYHSIIITKKREAFISGMGVALPFYPKNQSNTKGYANLNLNKYFAHHQALNPSSHIKLMVSMGRYFSVIYTVSHLPEKFWNFKRTVKISDVDLLVGHCKESVSECEFMEEEY